MATITERIDTRTLTRDANGQAAGSREFTVVGAQNAAAAKIAWEGLADGKVHPDDSSLVFDRIDIRGLNGNTLYIVRASYSTFKGGRRQQDPTIVPPVPFFGWDRSRVDVDIPLAYQVDITTTSGDTSVTQTVWTATKKAVTERRVVRTLKVQTTILNSAQLDIIADQERKLHLIRGRQYLFTGASVSQDSNDQTAYTITYSWELDVGTIITPTPSALIAFEDQPLPDPGNGLRNIYILAPSTARQNGPNAIRIRTPYHTLDVVASRNPTTPPRAVELLTYEVDNDGWRSLPGMVAL